ncbi:MAG: PAS domain S-box protein [Bacteroidetes bacterium]|nr:PAS domain S-box protein [Bacteroidota bacterium]
MEKDQTKLLQQAREEARYYKSLLDSQSVYVVTTDVLGNYTYLNDRFCRDFGIERAQVLGQPLMPLILPLDQQKFEEAFERAKKHPGDPQAVILRKKNPEGRVRIIQWEFNAPNADESGVVSEILCTGYDITEKVRMETDLSILVSNMSDVILSIDTTGTFFYATPSIENAYGYQVSEIIGKNFVEFVHPDDLGICLDALAKVVSTLESVIGLEHRIRHKSGVWKWSSTNANVDPTGGRAIISTHDITERKIQDQKLKELALVVSSTTDVIVISDAQGVITWVNDAYTKLTEYSFEEAIGKKPSQLVQGPDSDQNTILNIREALRNQRPIQVEILNYTKSGKKYWLDLSIDPVFDEHGICTNFIAVEKDITKRKQAEEELRRTKEMLEQTNEVAKVGGWEVNLRENTLYWSEVTRKIHGADLTAQPSLEHAFSYYKEGYSRDTIRQLVDGAIQHGIPYQAELQIITTQGKPVWIRTIGKPVMEDGKCVRLYGTFQDINELKAAEDKKLEMTELLKTLTDEVPGGLYQFSLYDDGRIEFPFVSSGMYELFDVSAHELQDQPEFVFQTIHPDDVGSMMKSVEFSAENLTRWKETFRIKTRKGAEKWLQAQSRPERHADRVTWSGYMYDCTQEKMVEVEIMRSEAKYRALYDSTSDPVVLLTDTGFFDGNEAALTLFGCQSKSHLCALSLNDISPEHQMNGERSDLLARMHIQRAFTQGTERFEWLHKRVDNDEVFYAEVVLNVVNIEQTTCLQAVIRDISERKKFEQEILGARAQAEQASRFKSEFLANMSHEIRTPLNGVIGFVDLLMRTKLDATQKEYMSTVFQSANALLDIINDILDFSKIEAGKLELSPEKTDLIELGGQVADMIKYQAHKKHLEMLLHIEPTIPRFIWCDPIRLRQVLVNLLGNAVKFTQEGEIELSVKILKRLSDDQTLFRFAVRDTGVGIDPKNQLKIFDAFSQEDASTTRKFGGTGLGLTISNKLLALMGSAMQLNSEPGKGSMFYFDIAFKTTQGEPIAKYPLTHIRKVLVVDDNETNRQILREMLNIQNIVTEHARNGIEALEKLKAGQKYDVILMDYHMPYLDGLETIRNIRNTLDIKAAQQPVILLFSSSDDEFINAACKELGVRQKIVKPIKINQLYESLSRLNEHYTERDDKIDSENTIVNLGVGLNAFSILVAEDNPVNMLLAKTIIESILPDTKIIAASNGREAFERFVNNRPDLVFMDIQMPEMNGYEASTAIRKIEKEGNRTPIIALTAGTVKGERERCLAAGMDEYVTKPVLKETIEQVILKWLIKDPKWEEKVAPEPIDQNSHFNADQFESLLGNDAEMIRDMLTVASDSMEKFMVDLNAAILLSNFSAIKSYAHQMKGGALTLTFGKLGMLCAEMEHLNPMTIEAIKSLQYQIESEIGHVKSLIAKYM